MRIELGPDGKIIGTRRVSPNGQVSGLSDYAGREVLVLIPGGSDSSYGAPWPAGDDTMRMVNDQIRRAYDQYRALQDSYASPWEATRSFLEGVYGTRFPDLTSEVDRWVRSQVAQEPATRAPGRNGRAGGDPPSPKTPASGASPSTVRKRKRR